MGYSFERKGRSCGSALRGSNKRNSVKLGLRDFAPLRKEIRDISFTGVIPQGVVLRRMGAEIIHMTSRSEKLAN